MLSDRSKDCMYESHWHIHATDYNEYVLLPQKSEIDRAYVNTVANIIKFIILYSLQNIHTNFYNIFTLFQFSH